MRYFGPEDAAAILRGGLGDQVRAFEREFAAYAGTRHAVGTSYGRTALHVGLLASGATGREVVLPAFTCAVVRQAVAAAGARPVFADVDPESFDFDLDDLAGRIGPQTHSVVLTHFFGRVARNIEEVRDLCRRRGVALVEDCAHSLGASFKGKRAGSLGLFSIFSLTKSTYNCGGGVLVTDDDGVREAAARILAAARGSRADRLADIPLTAAVAIEQAALKLSWERVGRHREWPVKLSKAILDLRYSVLRRLGRAPQPTSGIEVAGAQPYPYRLVMGGVSASLGRSQLAKNGAFMERRRALTAILAGEEPVPKPPSRGPFADAFSHAVFRFGGADLGGVLAEARARGVRLKNTWPARQKPWEGQDTPSVRRIAREVLVWCLNPDLDESEAGRARAVLERMGGRLDRASVMEQRGIR